MEFVFAKLFDIIKMAAYTAYAIMGVDLIPIVFPNHTSGWLQTTTKSQI